MFWVDDEAPGASLIWSSWVIDRLTQDGEEVEAWAIEVPGPGEMGEIVSWRCLLERQGLTMIN